MPQEKGLSDAEVKQLCKETAQRFGLYQCEQCSKALAKALKAKGVEGERVRLKSQGLKAVNIVMKDPKFRLPFPSSGDQAIATNGQHFGVRVGGMIYCSVFREGIRAAAWQQQFDCASHQFSMSAVEKF